MVATDVDFPRLPVEDELAIRGLVARYAQYADAGELEKFASLFLEDATLRRDNSPPASMGGSGLPSETKTGHAEIKAMIQTAIIDKFKRKYRHQMTDLIIEPGDGPDDAKSVHRGLITNWRDGPGQFAMNATYTNTYKRTKGGWRFKSVSMYVLPD